jgi:hypothetical protein
MASIAWGKLEGYLDTPSKYPVLVLSTLHIYLLIYRLYPEGWVRLSIKFALQTKGGALGNFVDYITILLLLYFNKKLNEILTSILVFWISWHLDCNLENTHIQMLLRNKRRLLRSIYFNGRNYYYNYVGFKCFRPDRYNYYWLSIIEK